MIMLQSALCRKHPDWTCTNNASNGNQLMLFRFKTCLVAQLCVQHKKAVSRCMLLAMSTVASGTPVGVGSLAAAALAKYFLSIRPSMYLSCVVTCGVASNVAEAIQIVAWIRAGVLLSTFY
eukprot:GHUV01025807.1.p2 GENE.GHUV01025807.1~~GHUV01025807.1.p2  ORF type:complete len:121 (+),score=17.56 GHUV01025807.1:827-1189(+)